VARRSRVRSLYYHLRPKKQTRKEEINMGGTMKQRRHKKLWREERKARGKKPTSERARKRPLPPWCRIKGDVTKGSSRIGKKKIKMGGKPPLGGLHERMVTPFHTTKFRLGRRTSTAQRGRTGINQLSTCGEKQRSITEV